MHVWIICEPWAWCLRMSEEATEHPGWGVTSSYQLPHRCWELKQVPWKNNCPNSLAISSVPFFSYCKESISPTLLRNCELPVRPKTTLLKMIRLGYLLLWWYVNTMCSIEAVLYIFTLSSPRIMISALYRCCVQ